MKFSEYLILKVALLSEFDDEQILERKLNHLKQLIAEKCVIKRQLRFVLEDLNTRCLLIPEYAVKVAIFTCSKLFQDSLIFWYTVNCMFADIIHENFADAVNWMNNEEEKFYNSVTLCGEFYNRIQIYDTDIEESIQAVLFKYLEMLLSMKTISSIKEIISQLMLNGSSLTSSYPLSMKRYIIALRKALWETTDTVFNAWLMVAIELEKNNFNTLDKDLETFYMDLIGKHTYTNMIRSFTACSITESSGTESSNSETTKGKDYANMQSAVKRRKLNPSKGNLIKRNFIVNYLLQTLDNFMKKYFGGGNSDSKDVEYIYNTTSEYIYKTKSRKLALSQSSSSDSDVKEMTDPQKDTEDVSLNIGVSKEEELGAHCITNSPNK